MKRSGPLVRRTPLVARTGLRRTALPASALSRARRAYQPKRPAGIPPKVRAALAARSGGMCEITAPGCMGRATDASHRKKVGAGGRKGSAAARHHVLSNLMHSCRGCHSGVVHAYPASSYWRGWMLREHENPAEVPALYRGVWARLTDEGGVVPT